VSLLITAFFSRFSVHVHLVLWLCLCIVHFGARDMAVRCVCCCLLTYKLTYLSISGA
jgi:hypothetical protein